MEKTNIKYLRIAANLIGYGMILAFVIYLTAIWNTLPEQLPMHFDTLGEPTSYGSRNSIFALPIAAVVILTFIIIMECFPNRWKLPIQATGENREALHRIVYIMLVPVKLLIVGALLYGGLTSCHPELPMLPCFLLLGAMLLTVYLSIRALNRLAKKQAMDNAAAQAARPKTHPKKQLQKKKEAAEKKSTEASADTASET